MSTPADLLLAKLDKVRQRSPSTWVACCPAHGDRHPSLSIRECEDGKLLINCVSRHCEPLSIVHAVGLELADLYPRPVEPHCRPRQKPPPPWKDIIKCLHHSLTVVMIGAGDLAAGKPLSQEDLHSLQEAVAVVKRALEESE